MANNPYVNKVELANGTTLIDISDTTAAAGDVLSGKYFYSASGEKKQGSIASKTSSNLSVSGATVTAPAGYYASNASASVASGSVTAPSAISGTSATVSTGTNTLTLTKTVSVTPTVSTAGYVSSGTAGNSSVSLTASVNTRSSSDLTASTLTVTAPAGYYASNASKTLSDENLVAGNIKKNVEIFGVTGSYEGGGGGTETIIIPEQTITASSSYTQIQFSKPLVEGDEYTYTVNGSTGTVTCVNMYGSLLCQIYINGGYVYFDYSSPNMYFDVNSSSQYGTYTVKLTQQSGGGGGSTLIEKSITANGTYNASDDDADGYSKVTVNVSGGGGLVYETGTYTPTTDTAQPTISFSNTHSTRPFCVLISDTSETVQSQNSNLVCGILSQYDAFGVNVKASSTSNRYGTLSYLYKASSNTTISAISLNSLTGSTTSAMPYWLSETGFKPGSNSTSRYWRSGVTYKWIAVWAPSS